MNIIAVDDEHPALRMLQRAVFKAAPDCSLSCFSKASEALLYARENRIDVAILDIEMAGMDGITLAKRLKEIYKKTNIMFVTGYQEYAVDAFSLAASGYVMKPVNPEAITLELNRLRDPIQPHPEHRVRIKCFGGFGVFIDRNPLLFTRTKVKELLAYLVHKQGVTASTAEISAVLWEDKEYSRSTQAQTQKTISLLIKLLEEAGIADVVQRGWNSMAVDIGKFSCDYYEHMDSNHPYIGINAGEYMNEYSWGEFMAGYLNSRV